jgi:nucleotide-binding universal stress UspA family protein
MNIKSTEDSSAVVPEVDRHDEPSLKAVTAAPFQFQKILVPIDFSECSKKALQYALPLAKRYNAALTLLNVVPIPPYAVGEVSGGEYTPSLARTSAEQDLAKIVKDVIRGEVVADTLVRNGSPATEIVELARAMPADAIIISTHGRSGLRHVLLGSVAEYVVRHAPCPVLVVRQRQREFLAGSGT